MHMTIPVGRKWNRLGVMNQKYIRVLVFVFTNGIIYTVNAFSVFDYKGS